MSSGIPWRSARANFATRKYANACRLSTCFYNDPYRRYIKPSVARSARRSIGVSSGRSIARRPSRKKLCQDIQKVQHSSLPTYDGRSRTVHARVQGPKLCVRARFSAPMSDSDTERCFACLLGFILPRGDDESRTAALKMASYN